MKPKIIAIDPGSTQSGYVIYENSEIVDFGKIDNHDLILLVNGILKQYTNPNAVHVVCEDCTVRPKSGREVGETIWFIGRLYQLCYLRCKFITINRKVYSTYFANQMTFEDKLEHNVKSVDAQVRFVLDKKYGKIDGMIADTHQARGLLMYYLEKGRE